MSNSTWVFNEDPKLVGPAAADTVKNVPGAAEKVLEFFSSTGQLQTTLGGINNSIQQFGLTVNGSQLKGQVNEDIYRRLKYQYANLYVATAVGGISNTIGGAMDGVSDSLTRASTTITETLKPVSSFIGSTLYTLTGVMANPIGALFDLPNTVGSMMDAVNPGLKAKFVGTLKKHNVDKLLEMPGQLFGSAQQIFRAIDGILSVPVAIISDIYRGLMDLIQQVSDFINGLFEALQKFITNIIDGLFPGILDFLNQLVSFANQIGGIMQIFAGSSAILGFTNQLIAGANSLNSFIQNPLDLAFSLVPPEVSQGIYALQNPQALLNQFLPPELSQYTQILSSITGFGFNGNMGFGLSSVLEGIQGGVLASILQGFATQFSILAPLFTGQSVTPPLHSNETTAVEVPPTPSQPSAVAYDKDATGSQVVQTTKPRPSYVSKDSATAPNTPKPTPVVNARSGSTKSPSQIIAEQRATASSGFTQQFGGYEIPASSRRRVDV